MWKKWMFIFTIFLLINCKEKESVFYYSLYDKDDLLIAKNKYTQTFSKIRKNEYQVQISGSNYNENFKMKIDTVGLYRYCDDHYLLTHHFDSLENQVFCKSSPPFIYKEVDWIKKRRYIINNKPYEVIAFSENSGSEIYSSTYYLKGCGFICYYNYKTDKYFLCDSVANVKFDLKILHEINNYMLHDKTLFERYLVKFPKVKFSPPDDSKK